MKTYKYTINGNKYEVAIGDITDNIATVTVNGDEYKVEMEPEAEPEKKKVVVKTGAAKESALVPIFDEGVRRRRQRPVLGISAINMIFSTSSIAS